MNCFFFLFAKFKYCWVFNIWNLIISISCLTMNNKIFISTLKGGPLKLMDKFTDLRSSISSNKKDINPRQAKAWTAISCLSVIWKSDLTDKIKRSFLQAAVESILIYGCTTWTLTKPTVEKLDGNYTIMLQAVLNKSRWQHPTKQLLYGYRLSITKTIHVRRTRNAGHCRRSKKEIISDLLLWTTSHRRAKSGRPARSYIQQLCADTGYTLEDLPDDRDGLQERVREIRASGAT